MLELGKIIITICLNISLIRTLTVGNGIAPFRPPWRFADFTAGEELHLALKYFIRFLKIRWICGYQANDVRPYEMLFQNL